MFGANEPLPPVVTPPPERSGRGAGKTILVILGCLLLEAPAYLLWNRTRRVERDVQALSAQAQEERHEVALTQAQSGAAITRAFQAQLSASAAAQQRDSAVQLREQAEQARTQSEQAAAEAQQRAAVAVQQAAQAQQEAQTLRAERQAELDRLQTVLARIANTRTTPSGLVVTLDSNAIRFDFDKAAIRPGNRELLSRMAGVLMTLHGYQINVYGYTDSVGTEQYNQQLSERRADAVRDYLAQAGVDANMMTTKGYGPSDPLAQGASAQARAKNRRVEIGIVDSVLKMLGEVPPAPGAPNH